MHSLKYQLNIIPFSIITTYKYFQYFTKHTIFSKMHFRECILENILVGMHSLKHIPKIEDPNIDLEFKKKKRVLNYNL
jgi:hypothetical protein